MRRKITDSGTAARFEVFWILLLGAGSCGALLLLMSGVLQLTIGLANATPMFFGQVGL
jgi:hypothetical protein